MRDRTKLIEFFETATMYRWYTHEIIAAIRRYGPEHKDLIDHFNNHGTELWYIDEIILELKS